MMMTSRFMRKLRLVWCSNSAQYLRNSLARDVFIPRLTAATDAKANKAMAEKAKGKGPLNAGQQGIKKSGKK